MRTTILPLAFAALLPGLALAADGPVIVTPQELTDWKSVYGQIEARNTIPARARLSGTLVDLAVSEGDEVAAGQVLGRIVDQTLSFRIGAVDAQIAALSAQLDNARSELARAEELRARGVATTQNVDALTTQVNVVEGQIAAQQAQRKVLEQQEEFGTITAPVAGRVVEVPVTRDAVVMSGEPVAVIGGGGFFLRLSVPERHAANLREGDAILITSGGTEVEGRLAKVYPLIAGGRVTADVEVPELNADFVAARVLVRLPMDRREAILIPADYLTTRAGLDFVRLEAGAAGEGVERTVVPGRRMLRDGVGMVEILTGLKGGETLLPPAVSHE